MTSVDFWLLSDVAYFMPSSDDWRSDGKIVPRKLVPFDLEPTIDYRSYRFHIWTWCILSCPNVDVAYDDAPLGFSLSDGNAYFTGRVQWSPFGLEFFVRRKNMYAEMFYVKFVEPGWNRCICRTKTSHSIITVMSWFWPFDSFAGNNYILGSRRYFVSKL